MTDRKTSATEIRKQVSEDYARNVSRPVPEACCQPSPNACCQPAPKGEAAKLAGYSAEEIADLPVDAAVNSFGCGNPLALAALRSGQTVLDLGSGAGIDIILAAKKVGSAGRVIGVDMTDEMIARANANVASAGLTNVEVRKGIIEDLPVETATVDWVISNCVINLSPEKKKVFTEIARVLRPGGSISISDIVAELLPPSIREHRALYSSCLSGAISESEYVRGLEEAGLTDVTVQERLVYDRNQLEGLIGSEVREEEGNALERDWAEKLAGKVWSIRVIARRRT